MSSFFPIQLVSLVLFCCASAFFASAETALFSLNPIQIHRIRRGRPKAARQIEEILAAPTTLLSTILIGNTIVNVAAADLGFVIAEHLLPRHGAYIAIPAMTLLLLVFGEVAPKRLAVRQPERIATLYVRVLGVIIALFTPARLALERITRSFEKSFVPRERPMSGEELRTVVDVGHQEGTLNREERAMMTGIIKLETMQASEVMTPRVDLIGIDLNSEPAGYAETARKSGFHLLPVYRGTMDQIEGFLDVPRFLLSAGRDLSEFMLHHVFVPETAPLDTLLTLFQQQNLRVAVVIDEYGGTAGLITRGDILEEIVEDVDLGRDRGKLRIESAGPNRWLVDAGLSLEAVNDELDTNLKAEGADRIAGWIIEQAVHVPKVGEVVQAQGCRATVVNVMRRRIRTVMLEKVEDG